MDQNDINQRKKELRKEVKENMELLTADYCKNADHAICLAVMQSEAFQQAQTIFCFVATKDEINTSTILNAAWAAGKEVAVPKCREKGIMHAYLIAGLEDLEEGQYGILEPKEHCPLVSPDTIDYGVIPCLSCDTKGYRLGHGGGYYDRYLANTPCFTSVLCRNRLLLRETPVDRYDLQMDQVITETQTILITKK